MAWLRWEQGRQNTGYEKLLLLCNPWLLPFDCYLLRFREGVSIPPHTDPVENKRHYRLNVILKQPAAGGEFVCEETIWNRPRVKLFRPDLHTHSVTEITMDTRWVLSIGWVLPESQV